MSDDEVAVDLAGPSTAPAPSPAASSPAPAVGTEQTGMAGSRVDALIDQFKAARLAATPKSEAPPAVAPPAEVVTEEEDEPTPLGAEAEAEKPPEEPPPAVTDDHAATMERYTELVKTVEAEREQLAAQRARLDYLDSLEVDFRISPGQAIADFARKAAGENDATFREYIADAISELTAVSLDAKLDTDTRVRQLDRKVRENEKLSKLHQVKLEQEAKERAFRQEVDASRTMVAQALGSLTNEYPYLLAEDDAANMIVSIGEREYKETGKARNWQQIAAALNKDLETKHAAKLSRLEKLKGPKPAPQNTTNETKSDTAKSVPRTLGTKAASEPAETPGEQERAPNFETHVERAMKKFAQEQRMTTTNR